MTSKTPSLFQGGIRFQDGTLQTTAMNMADTVTAAETATLLEIQQNGLPVGTPLDIGTF